ncbi:hypothetical protein EDC56_3937 [Sinobacterium caligoides]|uniref:Penicillin-binding protein activator n=1 Tax=Sinobacterium caligoides TaxID=933926 RepID=A0A3N2D4V2_9GAMM|nr:penicillin-binding protein activator [Sinobacterium caligoides]ROR94793.1 hypothetical protein EDC56_3937 [Sinobacterium caligoides]
MTINYARFLQYSILCLVLAGCQSPLPNDTAAQIQPDQRLEQLLKDSRSSNQATAIKASLEAAILVADQQPELARQLIQPLSTDTLNRHQQAQYLLVTNELLFDSGDYEKVIENSLSANNIQLLGLLDSAERNRNTVLTANSYALQGQYLTAAKLRIALSAEIANNDALKANNNAIWRALAETPSSELDSITKDRSELAGWIALTKVARTTNNSLNTQLSMLQKWQQQWPQHPATKALPGGLGMLQEIEMKRPKHIALLVPLSGKLTRAGESIRDGFLAAHYQTAYTRDTTINVYDSQSADIESVYNQAVADGAQLIIGPLTKDAVTELANKELSTPVLSLNYSTSTPVSKQFYQLSMSTSDEITLITQQAKMAGIKRVLLFYPQSTWGTHVAEEYRRQWQQQGGIITAQAVYSDERSMAPSLKTALRIEQSEKRAREISRTLGEKVESKPHRRQDLDAVFVVAKSKQGRSVRPLLDFYYANDLPVYATSHIYSGTPNPSADSDLNGIMFSELPWVIEPSTLKQQINNYISAGGNYSKSLYALGVDAYSTAPRIKLLEQQPESRIYGETGTLKMLSGGKITRQPGWAVFRRGYVKQLPKLENTDL